MQVSNLLSPLSLSHVFLKKHSPLTSIPTRIKMKGLFSSIGRAITKKDINEGGSNRIGDSADNSSDSSRRPSLGAKQRPSSFRFSFNQNGNRSGSSSSASSRSGYNQQQSLTNEECVIVAKAAADFAAGVQKIVIR